MHRSDKHQIQCSGYCLWVYVMGNGSEEMYTERASTISVMIDLKIFKSEAHVAPG